MKKLFFVLISALFVTDGSVALAERHLRPKRAKVRHGVLFTCVDEVPEATQKIQVVRKGVGDGFGSMLVVYIDSFPAIPVARILRVGGVEYKGDGFRMTLPAGRSPDFSSTGQVTSKYVNRGLRTPFVCFVGDERPQYPRQRRRHR